MNPSDKEDRQILSRCIAGDRAASEEFVKRFSGLVYWSVKNTLVLKHVRFTDDDLADIHNTIFLNLFDRQHKKLRQFKGDRGCSLASWIRTVAVRLTLNHLRNKGPDGIEGRDRLVPLEDLHDLKTDDESPWERLEKSEKKRMFTEGVQTLPPRERFFLKLHFEQELPISQVAEMMRITPQNAYTIKHRAIQKLKTYVESLTK